MGIPANVRKVGRGVNDRGLNSGKAPGTSPKNSPTSAAGFKKSAGDGRLGGTAKSRPAGGAKYSSKC